MTESVMKGLRLYDTEQYIVTSVAARMFEGNESQAIRFMIREYAKDHPIDEPDYDPLPLLQPAGESKR